MRTEFKVTGIEEVRAALERVGKDFEQTAGAALMAAGFEVSNQAKRNAPHLSGNLESSIFPNTDQGAVPIRNEISPPPVQTVETLTTDFQAEGKATVYIGTNVDYAPAQEFLPYEHKKGKSPYLRPALEEKSKAAQTIFQKAFKVAVDNAGRK